MYNGVPAGESSRCLLQRRQNWGTDHACSRHLYLLVSLLHLEIPVLQHERPGDSCHARKVRLTVPKHWGSQRTNSLILLASFLLQKADFCIRDFLGVADDRLSGLHHRFPIDVPVVLLYLHKADDWWDQQLHPHLQRVYRPSRYSNAFSLHALRRRPNDTLLIWLLLPLHRRLQHRYKPCGPVYHPLQEYLLGHSKVLSKTQSQERTPKNSSCQSHKSCTNFRRQKSKRQKL